MAESCGFSEVCHFQTWCLTAHQSSIPALFCQCLPETEASVGAYQKMVELLDGMSEKLTFVVLASDVLGLLVTEVSLC